MCLFVNTPRVCLVLLYLSSPVPFMILLFIRVTTFPSLPVSLWRVSLISTWLWPIHRVIFPILRIYLIHFTCSITIIPLKMRLLLALLLSLACLSCEELLDKIRHIKDFEGNPVNIATTMTVLQEESDKLGIALSKHYENCFEVKEGRVYSKISLFEMPMIEDWFFID